jgi:glucokinase
MAAHGPRLLGDVGGTNARFAWQSGPGADPVGLASFRCADFESIEAVLRRYLDGLDRPRPAQGAIGIANPVDGDRVRMTNHAWQFSIDALRRSLGLDRLLFVNDFAALALALPTLRDGERRPVRAAAGGRPGAALALLGPGTGLGVAGLSAADAAGRRRVIAGEGGHVTLAAADDEEQAVVAWLRRRFGHASAERALSGAGLQNLHEAWCALHGRPHEALTPAQIGERAAAGGDEGCAAAVALFFALLGGVAGNLALTLGAQGGVYVGGGIVPKLGDAIDRSRFVERFQAKGRFAAYLGEIPVHLILPGEAPALRGAALALDGALD